MKVLKENEANAIYEGTTVVDFYADWCGPCQYMKPFFESAESKLNALGVTCYKINVDECEEISVQNKISFIPCVIVFKDGKELSRFTGAKDEAAIIDFVKKSIQ